MLLKLKQYLQFLKVGINNLMTIDKGVPNYIIQQASERFFDYIQMPHSIIDIGEPPYDTNWHKHWHNHICLPLHIGGAKLYKHICPYACYKDFAGEYDDKCDRCKNFVIIDSPQKHFLRVIQDDSEV